MGIQTATTGNLDDVQRVVLAQARFTEEHNAPCVNLIEKMTLKQGEKQITVPKVGTLEAERLIDGVDLVNAQDIGLTTTDLTTSEVGLKVIITRKLIKQFNEDIFRIVGRQAGDAIARIKDTDVIALFSGLNGGTVMGADNKNFTFQNAAACVANAKSAKMGSPLFIVHHPNAVYACNASVSTTGGTYPIPSGYSQERLADFWSGLRVSGVPVFEDGNIEKITGYDSGYGVIANRAAMVFVEQLGYTVERDYDISLRAWEFVVTCDYQAFELDDTLGAPLQYEIGVPATNN